MLNIKRNKKKQGLFDERELLSLESAHIHNTIQLKKASSQLKEKSLHLLAALSTQSLTISVSEKQLEQFVQLLLQDIEAFTKTPKNTINSLNLKNP